ncbi:hypothetical protein HA402_002795 [Bradysia odoriphaga]|nr:hypothetical protein HA402_002795 [Bradysia odoriphaga]
MAVPFYLPDEEHEVGSSSQPQSTTKSATPMPQSLTNEQLVQVLYETLSMYSASLLLLMEIDKDVDVSVIYNDKNDNPEIVLLFDPIRLSRCTSTETGISLQQSKNDKKAVITRTEVSGTHAIHVPKFRFTIR